jgi:hypothetical protein
MKRSTASCSAAADGPVPRQYDDAPALVEGIGHDPRDRVDLRRIGRNRTHIHPDVAVIGHPDAPVGQALRYVDVHRSGIAVEGEVHRLFEDVAGAVNVFDQEGLFVAAANIACESGVRSRPDVSWTAPRPCHSSRM